MTGLGIIRAILGGERDGLALARLKHPTARSSEAEIAKALTGDWRAEHLFCLRQAVEAYDFHEAQIAACDRELEAHMKTLERDDAQEDESAAPLGRKSRPRPYQPQFDQRGSMRRIAGVDLTRIDGIEAMTAQTILSEVGWDVSRFPSEKHFCSWLGLCPDNRITGGKVGQGRRAGGSRSGLLSDALDEVNAQAQTLADELQQTTAKLEALTRQSVTEDEVRRALTAVGPLWDQLFPAEQNRIVRLLVDRVEIREDGMAVALRGEGLGSVVGEIKAIFEQANGRNNVQ